MEFQSFVTEVLNEASKIANEKFGKVASRIKSNDPNQVLTEADLAITKFIVSRIKEFFPEHNLIDEETGAVDNASVYTWVIDPIDGTSNFAAGVPTYGIMIGLLKNDEIFAGGVSLPAFNELYYAEKGQGAYCNDQKLNIKQNQRKFSLIAYGIDGRPNEPEFTQTEGKILSEIALTFTNLRSSNSVFDSMMVAKGAYTALICQNSKIWDNVAQQIIIEEAGGIYTDFFGKPIDYTDPFTKTKDVFTFCAASPTAHEKMQKIIHKVIKST